ncbi:hypothetical protein B9Z19DRAFT_1064223 [Tuber borchii]|uniref:Uncharacterized protein n=1 Tax=Tuber borchii TaxID=42251 RepID=A0A2T6ZVF1_TUBBO|nr:hypothetical protein B9Z19DRAFT_1064223 [Tuber borchii]
MSIRLSDSKYGLDYKKTADYEDEGTVTWCRFVAMLTGLLAAAQPVPAGAAPLVAHVGGHVIIGNDPKLSKAFRIEFIQYMLNGGFRSPVAKLLWSLARSSVHGPPGMLPHPRFGQEPMVNPRTCLMDGDDQTHYGQPLFVYKQSPCQVIQLSSAQRYNQTQGHVHVLWSVNSPGEPMKLHFYGPRVCNQDGTPSPSAIHFGACENRGPSSYVPTYDDGSNAEVRYPGLSAAAVKRVTHLSAKIHGNPMEKTGQRVYSGPDYANELKCDLNEAAYCFHNCPTSLCWPWIPSGLRCLTFDQVHPQEIDRSRQPTARPSPPNTTSVFSPNPIHDLASAISEQL